MTCRESTTVDLADFLTRASAPEFAGFRAHYPRCADCAAEVRAWSELHAALSASAHPSPDTLLRYQDARLAETDRRGVARHLAACAPCRDELRALAAFDRDAARTAPAVVAERRPRLRMPHWGRFVLHPALAYGLVLALLFYPALSRRDVPSAPPHSPVADEGALSDRLAAPSREERAPPAARSRAEIAEVARESDARQLAGLARAKRGGEDDVVVLLGARAPTTFDVADEAGEVTLRAPIRSALRASGPLEVRVVDESGDREIRERLAPAAEHVHLRVPRAWLVPGTYRLEVRAAIEPIAEDAFDFEVRRPARP